MKVLIWSKEHNAWWRANSQGYATNLACAGLYERAEADSIASDSHGRDYPVSLEKAFCDLQQQAWNADMAMSKASRQLQEIGVTFDETGVRRRT